MERPFLDELGNIQEKEYKHEARYCFGNQSGKEPLGNRVKHIEVFKKVWEEKEQFADARDFKQNKAAEPIAKQEDAGISRKRVLPRKRNN